MTARRKIHIGGLRCNHQPHDVWQARGCATGCRDMLRRSPRRSAFADDALQLLPLPEPAPGERRRRPAGTDLSSSLGNCADPLFLDFLQVRMSGKDVMLSPIW